MACLIIRGINRIERPIITDALFSQMKGTGFKNHWEALFTDEGFVVCVKTCPANIIIKNLEETSIPSFTPWIVISALKRENSASPGVDNALDKKQTIVIKENI